MRRCRGRLVMVGALAGLVGLLPIGAGASLPTATRPMPATFPSTTAAEPGGALSDSHVRRAPVSPRVAKALAPLGEMRGMSINDVGADNRGVVAVTPTSRGWLARASPRSRSTSTSTSPTRRQRRTSGPLTPTDQEIKTSTRPRGPAACACSFMPVLIDTATNTWRGNYVPSDIDAFFASYTTKVLHYAELAQDLGVSLFYVGSENDSILSQTGYWQGVIAAVRKVYTGAISYLTTGHTPSKVKFWKQLDIASISPYFSLGEEATPSYDRIRRAWADVHTPYIRKLVKSLGGMPLVYGEIGYHSQQGAFAEPAAPAKGLVRLAAPAAQADAYAALLDVMAGEPGVYGVTWWRWSPTSVPVDTDYSPANKPAECTIAAHWSQDARVRSIATLPACEQHTLDALLLTVSSPISQATDPR